jgi:hypothetical protein
MYLCTFRVRCAKDFFDSWKTRYISTNDASFAKLFWGYYHSEIAEVILYSQKPKIIKNDGKKK